MDPIFWLIVIALVAKDGIRDLPWAFRGETPPSHQRWMARQAQQEAARARRHQRKMQPHGPVRRYVAGTVGHVLDERAAKRAQKWDAKAAELRPVRGEKYAAKYKRRADRLRELQQQRADGTYRNPARRVADRARAGVGRAAQRVAGKAQAANGGEEPTTDTNTATTEQPTSVAPDEPAKTKVDCGVDDCDGHYDIEDLGDCHKCGSPYKTTGHYHHDADGMVQADTKCSGCGDLESYQGATWDPPASWSGSDDPDIDGPGVGPYEPEPTGDPGYAPLPTGGVVDAHIGPWNEEAARRAIGNNNRKYGDKLGSPGDWRIDIVCTDGHVLESMLLPQEEAADGEAAEEWARNRLRTEYRVTDSSNDLAADLYRNEDVGGWGRTEYYNSVGIDPEQPSDHSPDSAPSNGGNTMSSTNAPSEARGVTELHAALTAHIQQAEGGPAAFEHIQASVNDHSQKVEGGRTSLQGIIDGLAEQGVGEIVGGPLVQAQEDYGLLSQHMATMNSASAQASDAYTSLVANLRAAMPGVQQSQNVGEAYGANPGAGNTEFVTDGARRN